MGRHDKEADEADDGIHRLKAPALLAVLHLSMSAGFISRRWSTPTLISVGVVLGVFGYVAALGEKNSWSYSGKSAAARAAEKVSTGVRSSLLATAIDDQAAGWQLLMNEPRTQVTERKLLAMIEGVAARDHAQAFVLVRAEPNWRLRTLLRDAVLRGWASVEPEAAAQFALTLPERERRDAVAAVLEGAAGQPEIAAKIATDLCAQDPALAGDHGRALVKALSDAGAFSVAVRFASADTSDRGAECLSAAFYEWASRQPSAARSALDAMTATARRDAFQGFVLGWSMADPAELATYAASLPAGEERSQALKQALDQWVGRDPVAVANWIDDRLEPSADLDLSAATVATMPALVTQRPDVALSWAQSIVEPALRESTLTILARQWADRDRAGARRLIEQTAGLSPVDRGALLRALEMLPEGE